jgi:hypothetical protein
VRARRRCLGLALTGLLAVLPLPFASSTTVPVPVVHSAPLALGRALHALPPGTRLVAVTWQSGDAAVRLRWRGPLGWSRWVDAEEELAGESGLRRGTEPVWLPGGAKDVDVDVTGHPRDLRLVTIGERSERRWFEPATAHAATTGQTRLGTVITRAGWGADERIRKAPRYAARVDAVVVHHTVTGNDYTAAEAPAMIRSVYAYHVRSRGYDDLAYNFLVDRYGKVYQGRAGGIDRAVIGSHAMGFNTGTSGISLLGNLEAQAPPAVMMDAVARTTAYLSERWGFDARGTLSMVSRGSTRYREGVRVTVPRVMGHRDVGTTACPGKHVYGQLGATRTAAFRYLAPIITNVKVTAPAEGRPATVTARLTGPAKWHIEIKSRDDMLPAARGTAGGQGVAPALTWNPTMLDGLMVRPGTYDWIIRADDGVHGTSKPVSGTFTVALLA